MRQYLHTWVLLSLFLSAPNVQAAAQITALPLSAYNINNQNVIVGCDSGASATAKMCTMEVWPILEALIVALHESTT
jgi:hypothetical protein